MTSVPHFSCLATGAQVFGWPLAPDTTTAIAIPFVALGVRGLLHRVHARIHGH